MAECFWQDFTRTIEECDEAAFVVPPYGDFIERAELTGPGGIDEFGTYVAIDKETAMITFRDLGGSENLEVVVYENVAEIWTEGVTLTESQDMQARTVSGDLAIFTTDDGAGQTGIYVYERDAEGDWGKLQTLSTPNGDGDTLITQDAVMSADGEWIAHSILNITDSTYQVDMYKWGGSSFAYSSTLTEPDGAGVNDGFGSAVALSTEGTLVVGADSDDAHGSNDGSAYVYTVSGTVWSLLQTIDPELNESSTRFGTSVAITADASMISVGDRRHGISTYLESGGSYTYDERMDPTGIGPTFTFLNDDALTVIGTSRPFALDSAIQVYEYDEGFGLSEAITPSHPDIATAWIDFPDIDMRDGFLIVGAAEYGTGDGELDGQGYVYIYSRDPVEGGGDG